MLIGAAIAPPVAGLCAAVLAAGFPPVSVNVAPELTCPTSEAIERAITAERKGDPAGAGPSYRLRLAAAGDTIRVDLTSPDGVAVWSRSLPAGPAACTSGAEAVALIVEREFREIAWTSPVAASSAPRDTDRPVNPPPATTTTTASTTTASIAVAPPAAAATTAARASAPPSLGPRLAASIGPALWSRAGTPSLAVEARVRVGGAVEAGLGAIVPPSTSNLTLYTAADGSTPQAKVLAVPFVTSLGLERPLTRSLTLGAGAEGLLTFERGESVGIASPRTAWRTVLAGGLAAGGALALGDRLRIDVRAAAYRTVLGRSFTVDGLAGDVLEPPAWQALVRVGLGWVFIP